MTTVKKTIARGGSTRLVTQAGVAGLVSRIYAGVGDGGVYKHRVAIQAHAQRCIRILGNKAGGWPVAEVAAAIRQEIKEMAEPTVTDAAKRLFPDWYAQTQLHNVAQPDPAWDVAWPEEALLAKAAAMVDDRKLIGEEIDHPDEQDIRSARLGKKAASVAGRVRTTRSVWLLFIQQEGEKCGVPNDALTALREHMRLDTSVKCETAEGWWGYVTLQVFEMLAQDARLYPLAGWLRARRARAAMCGVTWLAGTPFSTQEMTSINYAGGWLAHLARLRECGDVRAGFGDGIDLVRLSKALKPERDLHIGWGAYETLEGCDALWPVACGNNEAREPVQWALARLAVEAAGGEQDATAWAGRFYAALSRREIVMISGMREAGRKHANYLDDGCGRVGDSFEAIHEAIYDAIVTTKWNGSIALDWRCVRARGATIQQRRSSPGVLGFWDTLNMGIAAQGRNKDDRPVTVSLPLWHLESEEVFEARTARASRLEPVLVIPDLFFERVRNDGMWSLFDPGRFPELLTGPDGYIQAEASIHERSRRWPGCVKTLKAKVLWERLLAAMRRGSPFLVFEGSLLAGSAWPKMAPPCCGVDGVGALPIPMVEESFTQTRWAGCAVNLAATIDASGNPDVQRMGTIVNVALRLVDNLMMRSRADERTTLRSTCLGAIGYHEVVKAASAHLGGDKALLGAWAEGLAKAWRMAVDNANKSLAKLRGGLAADMPGERTDPQAFRDRLREMRDGQYPDFSTNASGYNSEDDHPNNDKRFAVCSVWAPFEDSARVAEVTPGGLGTLRMRDTQVDFNGTTRLLPTAFLMHEIGGFQADYKNLSGALGGNIPTSLFGTVKSDRQQWETRLEHAALMRPWIDQGVSVTLPSGLPEEMLSFLVHRAWWLGLTSLRFSGLE